MAKLRNPAKAGDIKEDDESLKPDDR